jgi:hypothetical protein
MLVSHRWSSRMLPSLVLYIPIWQTLFLL